MPWPWDDGERGYPLGVDGCDRRADTGARRLKEASARSVGTLDPVQEGGDGELWMMGMQSTTALCCTSYYTYPTLSSAASY